MRGVATATISIAGRSDRGHHAYERRSTQQGNHDHPERLDRRGESVAWTEFGLRSSVPPR